MNRLIVIFFAFVAFSPCCLAQSTTGYVTEWSDGFVIFSQGDTVTCEVRYNHSAPVGTLQIRKNDYQLTVAPEDVRGFQFFDRHRGRTRRFVSLQIDRAAGQPDAAFMECLYMDDRVSILNHRTVGLARDYMNYTWFVSKPARLSRKYLYHRATGRLLPMSRENALEVLDHNAELVSYIEAQRLRFKSVSDYVKLFQYYCSL